MNDYGEKDLLAAEYVLGTLETAERDAVEAQRLHDDDLDAAIDSWDARMIPYALQIEERKPGEHILPELLQRIDADNSAAKHTPDNIVQLHKQVRRWKGFAIAASILVAALTSALLYRPTPVAPVDQQYVAVFQSNDQQPAFMLSVNLDSRDVTISPITASQIPDKTYQLWILQEDIGPTPQSLGLLDGSDRTSRKSLADYDVEVLKAATFGISVEPPGGSPTGKPSPGAIHGFLYPVDPE